MINDYIYNEKKKKKKNGRKLERDPLFLLPRITVSLRLSLISTEV